MHYNDIEDKYIRANSNGKLKNQRKDNYGIYTGVEDEEQIMLDVYMNSNKNSNNLQIGNLGAGTEFHLRLQNYRSNNFFKIAALNYLDMLPSTTQLCEAIDENKILEILNSSLKNKHLESIKVLKEPLEYIKRGITEMYEEYRKIEDSNNPCVDEIIKFTLAKDKTEKEKVGGLIMDNDKILNMSDEEIRQEIMHMNINIKEMTNEDLKNLLDKLELYRNNPYLKDIGTISSIEFLKEGIYFELNSGIRNRKENWFKNITNIFNNKTKAENKLNEQNHTMERECVNTEVRIEPLKFYDLEKPTLIFTNLYDLEKLVKKSIILSTKFLEYFIHENITNEKALIYYSHGIKYIVEDISELSLFINEKLNNEDLLYTIPECLRCLSELYACCNLLKENIIGMDRVSIYQTLDDILTMMQPYIKHSGEGIDYEEMREKIYLRKIQNVINNEIGKCGDIKKLSNINYIVTMLLREDWREVEDIAEEIRKRCRISKN